MLRNGGIMTDFEKCTNTVFDGDLWDISCSLGLWSVSGACKDEVQDEALHYFRRDRDDGEYSDIIGDPTVLEVMTQLNT
jgi:hypothetical protein